jgi:hypothetical protein
LSLFVFLTLAAGLMILTVPFLRRRRAVAQFDPGSRPVVGESLAFPQVVPERTAGIHLGGDVYWHPEAHPNPHVLIVGGSGTGKTWTMRLVARELSQRGRPCLLLDFHGDLVIPGIQSYPISLDSRYGVNPLDMSMDREGGGPDPQRFEVVEQLRNAFRPMGGLQLVLLDACLRETYSRAGVVQPDHTTWNRPAPHFGHLLEEIDRRIKADPKATRIRGLRAKLAMAFDFQIFSKPNVPVGIGAVCRRDACGPSAGKMPALPGAIRLDLSKLPAPLQYLAADTLLKMIFRQRQLQAPTDNVSLYLLIDETKLCTPVKKDAPFNALNRIVTEGRKFGLGLILSSQFVGHVSRDVLVNTFTKILMRVDKTEIGTTSRRFRLEEALLQSLEKPGDALINFANSNEWKEVRIGQ